MGGKASDRHTHVPRQAKDGHLTNHGLRGKLIPRALAGVTDGVACSDY